jgi:hypothetical protein
MTEDGKPVADDDRPQRDEGTPQGTSEQLNHPVPSQPPTDEAGRGRIRYQDPESTTPREPTLAEQRARIAAEKRREEQHRAEVEAATRKTQKRRRIMIGGGATVGVVALVAALYSASEISNEANAVTEYCATNSGEPVAANDENCDENYVRSQGGYVDHGSGFIFMPLFLGGPPVPQYRYAYTAPGSPAPAVGSTASGASFTKPADSTIKNKSGSTIQRGGFGINSKSGSGGS